MALSRFSYLYLFFPLVFVIQGCSPILAQKEQRTPTNVIIPETIAPPKKLTATPKIRLVGGAELTRKKPGEPGGDAQVIYDQSSASTAAQKKAFGGDEYSLGRFERPFNPQMEYIPGLDIVRADLYRPGDDWVYITITLEETALPPPSVYGVEIDLNVDGRGDLLVRVSNPTSTEWADAGIKTWWDSDGDVGGRVIVRSDTPGYRGSGFETVKVDATSGFEPGKIWTRSSTISNHVVQFAILEELVGGKESKFTWKPFTDGVPFPPSEYDLNDYYSLRQAGSPLIGERDYPLKEVHSVDNTCRGLSGLSPSGREQGVCPP